MKKKWIIPVVVLVLLAAATVGIYLYSAAFITIGGERFSRQDVQLDLRHLPLTAAEYEEVRAELPQTDILWNPPFQGTAYPADTTEFTVTELTAEDVEALDYFEALTTVDGTNCQDYGQLLALTLRRPQCRVLYGIPCGEKVFDQDTQAAEVADADLSQVRTLLDYLPRLNSVFLTGKLPSMEEIDALAAEYPDKLVSYEAEFFGMTMSSAAEVLDLTDIALEGTAEVEAALPYLPNVTSVILCGTGLGEAEVSTLMGLFPRVTFIFDLTIGNTTVCTDAEEIDISGNTVTPEQIEACLPYFTNLTKVVMCDCGIDNETMDALNRRHEDIKFVWSVSLGGRVTVRTDITSFIPFKLYVDHFEQGELYNLRYCTDMVALDLGHQLINTCEFVAFMPNLKYLIIADTQIMDISPLAGLTNLEYLEMFLIYSQDYTPLLTLTNLRDLNLAWTYGDYKIIAQMPWLERCWWGGKWHNQETRDYLTEHCPNTLFEFDDGESTGSGWREGELYYEMRDALGMFYMH